MDLSYRLTVSVIRRMQTKDGKKVPRKYFEAEWTDPKTGRRKRQSLKTAERREAMKLAGQLERDLRDGINVGTRKVEWNEAKMEYFEHLRREKMSAGYLKQIESTFRKVQDWLNVRYLQQIDEDAIRKFQRKLADQKGRAADGSTVTDQTIKKCLTHIKSFLRWAKEQKLLAEVPTLKMPRGSSLGKAKGRRLTVEEFERMLSQLPRICRNATGAKQTGRLMHGLWLTGLRLREALGLSWDPSDDRIWLDFTGKRPVLVIPEGVDKSKRADVLPLMPDFIEWLDTNVPREHRTGLVFPQNVNAEAVGKRISRAGRKAQVLVDRKLGKTASAHDLRRSFGTRWSNHPGMTLQALQKIMRHSSIETTMRYYATVQTEDLEAIIWGNQPVGQNGPNYDTFVPHTRNNELSTSNLSDFDTEKA